MSRSSKSNTKLWTCNNCLQVGDEITYKIKGFGDKPDVIQTKTVISADNKDNYDPSKHIIKGVGNTFAEVYDTSCTYYQAIGFSTDLGTLPMPFDHPGRIFIEMIEHRKYPRLKNPVKFKQDEENIKKTEQDFQKEVYEKIGPQDIENEEQVYIKTPSDDFYQVPVMPNSKSSLKHSAEEGIVYRMKPVTDQQFKMMLDNGIPLMFTYKYMNILVFPDIGTGELRRVYVNGIDQYRLHKDSVEQAKWFTDEQDAFKLSLRYLLGLDTPSSKTQPNVLYKHFKGFYHGDTYQKVYEQYLPDEKRLFRWNVTMNEMYNNSVVKTIDVIIPWKHSTRSKVAEMMLVSEDDVVFVEEVTIRRSLIASIYEYDVKIMYDQYVDYRKVTADAHNIELDYYINRFAHAMLTVKKGKDVKFDKTKVKKEILSMKEIDPLTRDPYDYFIFTITPDPKIVDLAEKWYKEKGRDKAVIREKFTARVQAENKGQAYSRLEEKYPSLLARTSKATFIDSEKALYQSAFLRRIYIILKYNGEEVYNRNVPQTFGEDPIYLAMEQIVYRNRVKNEPDLYVSKDFVIDVEYLPSTSYEESRGMLVADPIKPKPQRYFPPENFKGGRRMIRLHKQRRGSRSSKNIVVPIRKYEKDETEEHQIIQYIPQYSYEKVKIFFYNYETLPDGSRIKKGIDAKRSYETIVRKLTGVERVTRTITRPVRKKYKGIKNTKRRKSLALT